MYATLITLGRFYILKEIKRTDKHKIAKCFVDYIMLLS